MTEDQIDRILDRVGPGRVFKMLLLTACLGYLLDAFDNSLIGYALPYLAKDFRMTDLTKGYVLSAGLWGGVVGQCIWGQLAEKRGRLYAFRGTLLMFAGFTAMSALAWSPLTLFLTRFLAGAGLGGFVPIDTVTISEFSVIRRRGRYTGLISVLWPLGAMIGLGVSLLILPRLNWRWVFVAGILPAIAVWKMRARVPESPRWLLHRNRPAEAVQSLRELGASELILSEELQMSKPSAMPAETTPEIAETAPNRLTKHVLIAWCLWLANLYASMSLIVWLPSILIQVYHYSAVNSLRYTVLITVWGLCGRAVGVYFLDKAGRRASLGYPLLIAALCMFALGYIKDIHVAAIAAMAFYLFNEQAGVSQMAYIPELFPTQFRVRANAWCSAAARLVAATSPILIGYLLSKMYYQSITTILAASLFVPWVVFILWGPEMRGKGLAQVAT